MRHIVQLLDIAREEVVDTEKAFPHVGIFLATPINPFLEHIVQLVDVIVDGLPIALVDPVLYALDIPLYYGLLAHVVLYPVEMRLEGLKPG